MPNSISPFYQLLVAIGCVFLATCSLQPERSTEAHRIVSLAHVVVNPAELRDRYIDVHGFLVFSGVQSLGGTFRLYLTREHAESHDHSSSMFVSPGDNHFLSLASSACVNQFVNVRGALRWQNDWVLRDVSYVGISEGSDRTVICIDVE